MISLSTSYSKLLMNFYKKIGKNVNRIRKEKKLTQLQLASIIGHKSVGLISTAEICINNKHFNLEHLYKISEALEVDICEFFRVVE